MIYFLSFVILEFSFVWEADGHSSNNAGNDFLNMYLDYSITEKNILRDEMLWWTNQTTSTNTTEGTSSNTATKPRAIESTTEYFGKFSSDGTFVPMENLKSLSSNEVYKIINNLELFNKTVEQQILSTYGDLRPEKYGEIAMSLLAYFNSISKQWFARTTADMAATLAPTRSLRQPSDTSKENTPKPPEASKETTPKPPESNEKTQKASETSKEKSPKPPETSKKIAPKPHESKEKTPKPLETSKEIAPKPHESKEKTPKPQDSKENKTETEEKGSGGTLKVATPFQSKLHMDHSAPLPAMLPLEDYYQGKLHKYDGRHSHWTDEIYMATSDGVPDTPRPVFTLRRSPWLYEGNTTTPVRPGHDTTTRPDPINPTADQYTLVTKRKPLLSAVNPIVSKIKTKMDTKHFGYFTGFVQELFKLISQKEGDSATELFTAMNTVVNNLKQSGYLIKFGHQFENAIVSATGMLIGFSPNIIKTYSKVGVGALESRATLPQDIQGILGQLDQFFTGADGDELLNALLPVAEYPGGNNTSHEVATILVNKLLGPLTRDDVEEKRNVLVQLIDIALDKRGFSRRRGYDDEGKYNTDDKDKKYGRRKINGSGGKYNSELGDDEVKNNNRRERYDEGGKHNDRRRIHDDGGKYNGDSGDETDKYKNRRKVRKHKAYQNVDNNKATTLIKKFNDIKRKLDNLKDLIDNVKEIEAIEKYETMMVRSTVNYWPKFDRPYVISKNNNFPRRSLNQEFINKINNNTRTSNGTESKMNSLNNKDAVANFADGIFRNSVKDRKTEVKSYLGFKKLLGMDIDTDRSYEMLVSKSVESKIKQKHKLDKHTRHKVRKHLKEQHAKMYKILKKRHDRKKRKQINLKKTDENPIFIREPPAERGRASTVSRPNANFPPPGINGTPPIRPIISVASTKPRNKGLRKPFTIDKQPKFKIEIVASNLIPPEGYGGPPNTDKHPDVLRFKLPVDGGNTNTPQTERGPSNTDVIPDILSFQSSGVKRNPPIRIRKPSVEKRPLIHSRELDNNSNPFGSNKRPTEAKEEFPDNNLKHDSFGSLSFGVKRKPPVRIKKPSLEKIPSIHSSEHPATGTDLDIKSPAFGSNNVLAETNEENSDKGTKTDVFSFQTSSVKRKPPVRMQEPPGAGGQPPKTNKKPIVFYFESPDVNRVPPDNELKPDDHKPPALKIKPPNVDKTTSTPNREYVMNAKPIKTALEPFGGKNRPFTVEIRIPKDDRPFGGDYRPPLASRRPSVTEIPQPDHNKRPHRYKRPAKNIRPYFAGTRPIVYEKPFVRAPDVRSSSESDVIRPPSYRPLGYNRPTVIRAYSNRPSEEIKPDGNRPEVIRPYDNKEIIHYGNRPPKFTTDYGNKPSDIIKPPDELPSVYLQPRYQYNNNRFDQNLNLTRRSNAEPISTELSYSNEEKDVKFHLQDALRHPSNDLKLKIERNSIIYDEKQNGRRKINRIDLKSESESNDDESLIKSNIFKVFHNKN